MRRRVLTVVVFLLAGATLNVAVAWAAAFSDYRLAPRTIWEELDGPIPFAKEGEDRVKVGFVWRAPGAACLSGGYLLREHIDHDMSHERFPRWAYGLKVCEARGWPALSLCWWEPWPNQPGRDLAWGLRLSGTKPVREAGFVLPHVLPLRPIWSAFLVNTALYAAVLWLVVRWPFALRRFLRVTRGLCPRCAYPTGESSVCSECGRELPKRAVPT